MVFFPETFLKNISVVGRCVVLTSSHSKASRNAHKSENKRVRRALYLLLLYYARDSPAGTMWYTHGRDWVARRLVAQHRSVPKSTTSNSISAARLSEVATSVSPDTELLNAHRYEPGDGLLSTSHSNRAVSALCAPYTCCRRPVAHDGSSAIFPGVPHITTRPIFISATRRRWSRIGKIRLEKKIIYAAPIQSGVKLSNSKRDRKN